MKRAAPSKPKPPPAPAPNPFPPPAYPSAEERRRQIEEILQLPAGYLEARAKWEAMRAQRELAERAKREAALRRLAREEMKALVNAYRPRHEPPKG
jgi:hypothetical protein